MLDELQAEAPDYEIDPLNYLLSVGQSLEEIEQYRKDGIPLWEVARAVHNIQERGESLDDSQKFIARSADEFGEDKTEFVWYPYIPVGDYSVLMADGGTGKTILCCGIAAAISKGEALPGDYFNEWSNTPGNTLIISAEDRGELLKKRLAASGADLKNVYILDCMDSEGMDFTDGYEDFVQTINLTNTTAVKKRRKKNAVKPLWRKWKTDLLPEAVLLWMDAIILAVVKSAGYFLTADVVLLSLPMLPAQRSKKHWQGIRNAHFQFMDIVKAAPCILKVAPLHGLQPPPKTNN